MLILEKITKTPLFSERGFSLIEVLIAFAIFAIGFLAVGNMQIDGLVKTRSARINTQAITVAESQVEALLSLPFYDEEADLDDDGIVEKWDTATDLDAGDHGPITIGNFNVRWNVVDDVPLAAIPGGPGYPDINPVTRSKTITLEVWQTRVPDTVLARFAFVKIWAVDGLNG